MVPGDDDDNGQWQSEYDAWVKSEEEREEAERVDALNRLLRAVGDGTVYDTRLDPDTP